MPIDLKIDSKNKQNNSDVTFIICELNPLHFGHEMIIRHSKKPVVCIMSGNYVQRSEMAIMDKWSRAELALKSGANLVIELPLPWSTAGAERFAFGGVYLANAFNLSGELLFGSEEGTVQPLLDIAKALNSDEFSLLLEKNLSASKMTFAKTRENTIAELLGKSYAEIIAKPNNILGIEYIKALLKLNSPLTPATISRKGANHGQKASDEEYQSASQIRESFLAGEDISDATPARTYKKLNELRQAGLAPVDMSKMEAAILCKLRSMTLEELACILDISEGLEHKLFASIRKAASLEELYNLCKSKRYTHARIRKLVLSAFLGVTDSLPIAPPYLRVLGMDNLGEELIKTAKPDLPLLIKATDYKKQSADVIKAFELEAKADDIYALAMPSPQSCGMDFTTKIVKF